MLICRKKTPGLCLLAAACFFSTMFAMMGKIKQSGLRPGGGINHMSDPRFFLSLVGNRVRLTARDAATTFRTWRK
jgi:hypothetical protein